MNFLIVFGDLWGPVSTFVDIGVVRFCLQGAWRVGSDNGAIGWAVVSGPEMKHTKAIDDSFPPHMSVSKHAIGDKCRPCKMRS